MERLVELGRVRALGVSNFGVAEPKGCQRELGLGFGELLLGFSRACRVYRASFDSQGLHLQIRSCLRSSLSTGEHTTLPRLR